MPSCKTCEYTKDCILKKHMGGEACRDYKERDMSEIEFGINSVIIKIHDQHNSAFFQKKKSLYLIDDIYDEDLKEFLPCYMIFNGWFK